MAPRLVDRLNALLTSIDRVLAAPTPYQIAHFNELRAEFLADMGEVNQFVEKQVPEIDALLKRNSAATVKPVEVK
jgi:hypothetical protein